MPSFGKESTSKLSTCDPKLIKLFNEVIKYYDCIVICGNRSKAEQDKAVKEGKSKTPFPKSKHNTSPSKAVDVAPYFAEAPHIHWNDTGSFIHFAGFVKGIAATMDIKIRWGGDWDSDWDMKDQTFNDLPHFELID